MDILVEGKPVPTNDAESDAVWYRLVSRSTSGRWESRSQRGRNFEPREAAPAIIVSDATARRFWKDGDPTRPARAFQRGCQRAMVHGRRRRGRSAHAGPARREPQRSLSALLAVPRARHQRGPEDGGQAGIARGTAASGGARPRPRHSCVRDYRDVDGRRGFHRPAAVLRGARRRVRRARAGAGRSSASTA